MIEASDASWLCVASLEPLNDDDRDRAAEMYTVVQLDKSRSFWDRLLGRNRQENNEPVSAALASILNAQEDLRPRLHTEA
jgi:hypothetical protein